MKRKLCIDSIVCLVSLIWSGLEAEAQDIKYLLKTGHLKPHQAFFQAPLSPQLSDQTYLLSVTDSESEARKEMLRREAEKPPLKGGQVAGEILNGVVGEFLGMIGGMLPGAVLGGIIGEIAGDDSEGTAYYGALLGAIFGMPLGSAWGVYMAGDTENQSGSFLATLGGSLLGIVVGVSLLHYAGDEGVIETIGGVLVWFSPPIGATIGFNLTRRYKSPPTSETALINFSDGQMRLEVPQISFYPDRYARGTFTQRVDLVKVRF